MCTHIYSCVYVQLCLRVIVSVYILLMHVYTSVFVYVTVSEYMHLTGCVCTHVCAQVCMYACECLSACTSLIISTVATPCPVTLRQHRITSGALPTLTDTIIIFFKYHDSLTYSLLQLLITKT